MPECLFAPVCVCCNTEACVNTRLGKPFLSVCAACPITGIGSSPSAHSELKLATTDFRAIPAMQAGGEPACDFSFAPDFGGRSKFQCKLQYGGAKIPPRRNRHRASAPFYLKKEVISIISEMLNTFNKNEKTEKGEVNIKVEKRIDLEQWLREKREPKRKQTQHPNLSKLELLRNFERLNSEGKEKIADYSDILVKTGRYFHKSNEAGKTRW